jgi:F-type H+-transporting ATPase subunit delta
MTVSEIAARYAEALVEVVTASNAQVRPQQALAELEAFAETLRSSSELRHALDSPAVPNSRKKAVVARIGEDLGISPITRNFLFVLIHHRRMPILAEIVEAFTEVVDARLGFARAEITSARELSAGQRTAMVESLERLTGKRVRARYKVEDALLGGVVARVGSTVYDGSIRGQLRALERRLTLQD